MNTTDIKKIGYYEIKYVLGAYKLQEDKIWVGKIGMNGDIFIRAQYMSCMKEKENWY